MVVSDLTKTLQLLLVAVVATLCLYWRMPWNPDERLYIFCNNDAVYHLGRVQRCLETYPQLNAVDMRSHHPGGNRIHWPASHSIAMASVVKIFTDRQDLNSIVQVLAFLPPILSVVVLLLLMSACKHFGLGPWFGLAVAFVYAIQSQTFHSFFAGNLDHHNFTHLAILLMTLALTIRSPAPWIIGGAVLFLATPSGFFYANLFMAILTITMVVSSDHEPRAVWFLAPPGLCLAAWLLNRWLTLDPLPIFEGGIFQLSIWQVVSLSIVAAVTYLASKWWSRHRRSVSLKAVLTVGASLCIVGLISIWLLPELRVLALRLLKVDRLTVGEEISRLAIFGAAPSIWIAFIVVLCVYAAWRAWRSTDAKASAFAVPLFFGCALGLYEQRHLHVFSAIYTLGLIIAMRDLWTLSRAWSKRSRIVTASLINVMLLLLTIEWVDFRLKFFQAHCLYVQPKIELSTWLKQHAIGEGVMAPWDLGHQINILANCPVVVDPFNFPESIQGALDDVWPSNTPQALRDQLIAYDARYLVLSDPAGTVLTASQTGELKPKASINRYPVYPHAIASYPACHIYLEAGMLPSTFLQLRFLSSFMDAMLLENKDGEVERFNMPTFQAYEVKPGVRFEFEIDRELTEPIEIRNKLKLTSGNVMQFEFETTRQDGRYVFHTAQPAPCLESTFLIETPYEIRFGEDSQLLTVSQAMVDSGETIVIHLD